MRLSLLLCSIPGAGFCQGYRDTLHTFRMYASLPLKNFKLNSAFGLRTHPLTRQKSSFHKGIDLAGKNEIVCSVLSGVVKQTGSTAIMGKFVVVQAGRYSIYYAHLSKIYCLNGQNITTGFPIGLTGATGRVTGEHLHLSVLFNGVAINPLYFLVNIFSKSDEELYRFLNH